MRRPSLRLLLAAAFVCACAGTAPAHAQSWPQSPIRIIVGFGAGGGTDIVTRIIAQSLQEKLGQPVTVENRPGAGGTVGADAVVRAEKDGYTLGMLTNGHVIAGVLAKSPRYDTLTALEPIGLVATAGLLIVARPNLPAANVKELIEHAKQNPGKVTFASVGFGGTQHFTGERFRQLAELNMLHVPYRTSPEATAALLSGQVDLLFDTISAVVGPLQSGELKALAVTGRERLAALPDVPTVAESGVLPGFDVTTWYGLFAPRGTPAPVVARLNRAVSEALADPGPRGRLEKAGVAAQGSTPQAFGEHIADEFARWQKVRDAAGLTQQ